MDVHAKTAELAFGSTVSRRNAIAQMLIKETFVKVRTLCMVLSVFACQIKQDDDMNDKDADDDVCKYRSKHTIASDEIAHTKSAKFI